MANEIDFRIKVLYWMMLNPGVFDNMPDETWDCYTGLVEEYMVDEKNNNYGLELDKWILMGLLKDAAPAK